MIALIILSYLLIGFFVASVIESFSDITHLSIVPILLWPIILFLLGFFGLFSLFWFLGEKVGNALRDIVDDIKTN